MHVIRVNREKMVMTALISLCLVFMTFNGFVRHVRNHIDFTNTAILQLRMQLTAHKEEVEITRTTQMLKSISAPHFVNNNNNNMNNNPNSNNNKNNNNDSNDNNNNNNNNNENNNHNNNKNNNKNVYKVEQRDFKGMEYIDMTTKHLQTTSKTKYLKILVLTFGSAVELPPQAINQNNDVIYWHEPMKMWERIDSRWRGNDLTIFDGDLIQTTISHNNIKNNTYKNATQFYNEIMSCNFTHNIVYFLSEVVRTCPHFLKESETVSKILKCNDTFCNQPNQKTVALLNKLCKEKRYNVIVRESEERTISLEKIFSELSRPITQSLKILHLVRDPRSVFLEMTNSGRIPKNAFMEDIWKKGGFMCDKLYENILFAKNIREKYYLFRYEDFMGNEDMIKNLFNYDLKNRDGSQTKLTPWWRLEINKALSSQAENICWKSFDELGYEFLDSNIRIGSTFKRFNNHL